MDEPLKRPQYESVSISPDGEYLAVGMPMDDRSVLGILRRDDGKISTIVNPGPDGFVDSAFWVGDRRVFVEWSMRFGAVAQPYGTGTVYSTDVDGSNRRLFSGSVINPLLHDADNVQIVTCPKVVNRKCVTRVRKVRSDGRGSGEDIVDGPVPDAGFLTGSDGEPRFSWAWDDDDVERAFVRKGGAWIAINDESRTGVEVTPIGISHDRRFGYLRSERAQGSDVVERIEFASGKREVVASDPELDPTSLVWSFDGGEPIGVT